MTVLSGTVDQTTPMVDSTTQATQELTSAVTTLTQQLSLMPMENQSWTRPATHFVDSLPLYNVTTLSLVLIAFVVLGGSIIFALIQDRKNKHQQDMLKIMAVPIEAFTSMVQQSAASTELLGRRIESMSTQMENIADNIARLNNTIDSFSDHVAVLKTNSNSQSVVGLRTQN